MWFSWLWTLQERMWSIFPTSSQESGQSFQSWRSKGIRTGFPRRGAGALSVGQWLPVPEKKVQDHKRPQVADIEIQLEHTSPDLAPHSLPATGRQNPVWDGYEEEAILTDGKDQHSACSTRSRCYCGHFPWIRTNCLTFIRSSHLFACLGIFRFLWGFIFAFVF